MTITIDAAPPNRPPSFAGASASRSVAEAAGPGASVGGPVTATDPDEGDTLAYTLGGADAGLFAIGGGTGQITVGAGTTLDYETRTSYTVVVTATDPDNESAAITVTINVTRRGQRPLRQQRRRPDRQVGGHSRRNRLLRQPHRPRRR